MEMILSQAGNSSPAVQSAVELESSVADTRPSGSIDVCRSRSHALLASKMWGEKVLRKMLKKQVHCEHQTQEYTSINITQGSSVASSS